MKNTIFFSTVIFIVILLFHPLNVLACDCDILDNATEAMQIADAVFTGVVTKKKEVKIDGEMYEAALIQVDQAWKGVRDTEVIVHTDWSSCMFEFQIGEHYLMYANEYHNRLNVINCGRSSLISKASTDLLELGEGSEPTHEVNLESPFHTATWHLPKRFLLAAVLLVIIGGIVWRINKK